jgi:hypothetical protein
MDWDTIRESIQAALLATFDELILSVGDERLYVICLQTAEDAISIGAGANTEEGYSAKCASEADLENMTPEYRSYLRRAPAEWRFEVIGDANFSSINHDLGVFVDGLRQKLHCPFCSSDTINDRWTSLSAHTKGGHAYKRCAICNRNRQ